MTGYELEFEDNFDGEKLDNRRWIAHYLPHWSTWERSAARHDLGNGVLKLLIAADQEPWCPELDGNIRVSSLQTGLFAGPVGSSLGQHRFNSNGVVRQGPFNTRLYTPQYGLFEVRSKAISDPQNMVAFWMIGVGDEPDRSAEICICEIFGRDVTPNRVDVGVGVHPHGDPHIVDDFTKVKAPIDCRQFHVYQAEWMPGHVVFRIDGEIVKSVDQSPAYPMQLMLSVYEFPHDADAKTNSGKYPKRFEVDYVRGYRRAS